jgi:hypothetical protein
MADDWPQDVELSAVLHRLPPTQYKVRVPPPIVVRLDQLLQALWERVEDYTDVSHGELLAALIHDTREDELAPKVAAYKQAKVHETLLGATEQAGSYPLPERRVGRPPRPKA